MTLTKELARKWLLKKYRSDDVIFNKRDAFDFLLADGRKLIVKRPNNNMLFFTRKQWDHLTDDVEVVIMHEDSEEPLAVVRFADVRKAKDRGILHYRDKNFGVKVEENRKRVLVLRCSDDVAFAFKRYASSYASNEAALIALLSLAKAWPPIRGEIY